MNLMGCKQIDSCRQALPRATAALLVAAALALPGAVRAQAPFATPEQAADAFIDAAAVSDSSRLPVLLGRTWRQLLPPFEEMPAENRYLFLAKAHQSRVLKVRDGRAELVVGTDPWTLPIPLAQGADGQWRFDPVGAREEIRLRRIGRNELSAMQASLAYVDAQLEYATADRNGDGFLEYAQKLASSPGKRDGLIWSRSLGDDSPLGEDYLPAQPGAGYHGYRFRILTGQGPNARGGARSYLIGKRMVSGFGLVAWPVSYGTTGIMTFIVNQAGQIYERDLGPRTATLASAIKRFDPDDSWKPVKP
jgi:hypothetical protein